MTYESMTKDEARNYKDYLEELVFGEVNEQWFSNIAEETNGYYGYLENGKFCFEDEDTQKAWEDINNLIDEVDEWIDGYDEREKDQEAYIHMVEIESRYW